MAANASVYEAAMNRALGLARRSLAGGNYPVGAVVLSGDGAVVGTGANRAYAAGLPTEHAEMVAIRRARRSLGLASPGEQTVVTTGEPCLMCLGAILQTAAIGTVVWAIGPVSAAGSAWAAVQATGYGGARADGLRVIAEPSPAARSASAALLYRWCIDRSDPRAELFADAAGRGQSS